MNHKIICSIIQVLLGLTFLFSGVLKSLDVYGTMLKLDEYAHQLNFPLLEILDEPIAVILCAVETTIGLWLLSFISRTIDVTILIVLTLFFTILNLFFILNPDKMITDCGCFGELLPMSVTSSFIKNILILILAGYLLWHNRHRKNIKCKRVNPFVLFLLCISLLIPMYSIMNTSIYNPTGYNKGTDLIKKMDFIILDENSEDVTDQLLNSFEEVYIYIQKNDDSFYQSAIKRYCKEHNSTYFTLSNKDHPESEYNSPYYYTDENLLKSLLRCKGNGVVYIRNGIIRDIWPERFSWWKLDIEN